MTIHNSQFPIDPEVTAFYRRWQAGEQTFVINTSGSTGTPKPITLHRDQLIASAEATGAALSLRPGDRALVCLNPRYIAGLMMLVRGLVLGLKLVVVPAAANPLESFPPDTHFDFTAMVPLQLYQILTAAPEKLPILNRMKAILVGGAAINAQLFNRIQTITAPVYHTYGMTETITHIALRRLNGKQSSPAFVPLPGVITGLDERGCLTITAPVTAGQMLITNDRVDLRADKSFIWLGRVDTVINSGGVKVQPEQAEAVLEAALTAVGELNRRVVVTAVADDRLGEKPAAVIEGEPLAPAVLIALQDAVRKQLDSYHVPRKFQFTAALPQTPTGKIDRRAAQALFNCPDNV